MISYAPDADDLLLTQALETIHDNVYGTNADVALYDYSQVRNLNEPVGNYAHVHESFPDTTTVEGKTALLWLFEGRYMWNVWQVAVRRSVLISKKVMFIPAIAISEDLLFTVNVLSPVNSVLFMHAVAYAHTSNDHSAMYYATHDIDRLISAANDIVFVELKIHELISNRLPSILPESAIQEFRNYYPWFVLLSAARPDSKDPLLKDWKKSRSTLE